MECRNCNSPVGSGSREASVHRWTPQISAEAYIVMSFGNAPAREFTILGFTVIRNIAQQNIVRFWVGKRLYFFRHQELTSRLDFRSLVRKASTLYLYLLKISGFFKAFMFYYTRFCLQQIMSHFSQRMWDKVK